jgi:hypothetical protein
MYKFKYDEENDCFAVNINDKIIYVDIEDLEKICHCKKARTSKWFFDDDGLIHAKDFNNKQIYFLDVLFGFDHNNFKWTFNNNNNKDYRKNNIKFSNNLNSELPKNLEIIESFSGHVVALGKKAGNVFNPYWKVIDKKLQDEPFYAMYCESKTICYFSENSLDVISKDNFDKIPTWYLNQNGYIASTYNGKSLYMHQIIMNYYAHGNKKESIDHKNRNKLDNRSCNLRIITQSEQNKNTDKRKRKKNAKELPDGIKQSDMPKYVVYYKEILNKETGRYREWFNVEKHPAQNNIKWCTTKSKEFTIQEKLKLAKNKLEDLNKLVKNDSEESYELIEEKLDNLSQLNANNEKMRYLNYKKINKLNELHRSSSYPDELDQSQDSDSDNFYDNNDIAYTLSSKKFNENLPESIGYFNVDNDSGIVIDPLTNFLDVDEKDFDKVEKPFMYVHHLKLGKWSVRHLSFNKLNDVYLLRNDDYKISTHTCYFK